ncbi:hypothetical protein [Maribacter sp. 2210JD10-5]|uniref:hypothetical protein n=1 Tax=Maribacter sp. 2210JD10-5 TaxID=3386272 RepID=UPI0039BC94C8
MSIKFSKEVFEIGIVAFFLNLLVFFSLALNLILGIVVLIALFFFLAERKKLFYSFFILAVFFQNTFIAFFTGVINSETHFKILHGINFFLPSLLTMFVFKNSSEYFDKAFYRKSIFIIIILIAYFVFGIYGYGFLNSAQYLRLFLLPVLFLLSGIYFSKKIDIAFLNSSLKVMLLICSIITLFQFIFPYIISYVLNDLEYFSMKWGIEGWDELLGRYKSKRLFNISWFDFKLARIGSLIKSIISLGYFLTILGIYFYLPNNKFRLFGIILLVIFAVNSKGAVLVFLFSSFLYFLVYHTNLSKRISYSLYIFANLCLIYVGYLGRNEHIVGFVSGAEYLISFGNGLGFGGNLSTSMVSSYKGMPLTDMGYWTRFQNGSESVYGVLFSSLGIFSFFYLYYFFEIIVMLFRKFKSKISQIRVLNVLAVVLFVQGIYQEEAFSPYAFGLVMFLVGLNFKRQYEGEIVPV